MPAHIKDARGSTNRYEKMRIWKDADPAHCATCQAPLLATDMKDGCRRCRACRKASPGRPVQRREGPGSRSDHPNWLTVKSKAVTPAQTTSFWLDPACQDRAVFHAAIKAHRFSGGRKENPVAMSPGGFRDV